MKKFFCNKAGEFQVVYFWMSLMLTFAVFFLTLKFVDAVRNFINNKPLGISDVLLGILIGGVVAWAKFYNDKSKRIPENPTEEDYDFIEEE